MAWYRDPTGKKTEVVDEQRRHDDTREEIDHQVEHVAVDFREGRFHLTLPGDRPVDAVDHERRHEPQQGRFGLVVGDGDETEHPAQRTSGGEHVDPPRNGANGVGNRCP